MSWALSEDEISYVDILAREIAKYNVPTTQIRGLVDVLRRGGIKACEHALKEAFAKGKLPPSVMKLIQEILSKVSSVSRIILILVNACKIADYEYAKLFIEDLDEISKIVGIELKGDDIISVEVQRDKGRVKYYLSVKPELKKKLDRQVLGVALRKILRKKFGVPTPNIFVYFK